MDSLGIRSRGWEDADELAGLEHRLPGTRACLDDTDVPHTYRKDREDGRPLQHRRMLRRGSQMQSSFGGNDDLREVQLARIPADN